ncbi:MAG: flagellar hook-length control protein FliK [Geobacter sp.]|nr:flagellar hook-length control protein FliK [Geobacter sp.]
MDAAQILMMPMASTATVTTLSPDPGAAQTSGELSALFSDLLAQTVVTQTAAQQIPELHTQTALPDSHVVPAMSNQEQEQDSLALLMQNEPQGSEFSTTQHLAAVYAQLTTLQVPAAALIPQENLSSAVTDVADSLVAEPLVSVNVVSGSGQPEVSDLGTLQQNRPLHTTAAPEIHTQQLQRENLGSETVALQQQPLKTEETAGDPLVQDTITATRQTESRHQTVVLSSGESRVTEQQTQVQQPGGSQPPEQQKMEHKAGVQRFTDQQTAMPVASDSSSPAHQTQIQHNGNSRGQEQNQQIAVQIQSVRSEAAQDVSSVTSRPQAAIQAQAFRFAQSNEVAVAASDPGRQGRDFSEQQQSRTLEQSFVAIGELTEAALVENVGSTKPGQATDEHHQLAVQAGTRPQQAATSLAAADDLPKQVPGEQVARQVHERLSTHEFKQGRDQISLKLSPEHLGNVQLNLRMEDQGLKLEIIAEQRGVREALLRQGDELKETLARQNIRVDSFEVSTGNLGGQNQQQQREWRQMNPEQRIYYAQYASAARGGSAAQESSSGVLYFAPQYQSTIDVRF